MVIWLKEILMQILIWLLGFVDTIFNVFRAVAGLDTIATPNGEQSISEYFLGLNGVQWAFWVIFIASIGICAVCTVVAIVKNIINAKGGEPKSHARTIGQSLSTGVISLVMAMLLIVGVGCADGLLGAIDDGINHGEKCLMSHEIIAISIADGYVRDEDNILGLNRYNNDGEVEYVSYLYEYQPSGDNPKRESQVGITTVEYGKEYIVFLDETGAVLDFKKAYTNVLDEDGNSTFDEDGNEVFTLDLDKLTLVKAYGGWNLRWSLATAADDSFGYYSKNDLPDEIWNMRVSDILGEHLSVLVPIGWCYDGYIADPDDFNFIVAYVCTIVLFVALVSATFGLVKRLYDIVLLFIALPGITATIPLDDGAKFKLWRETVISKVFLAYGMVLAVNIFTIVAPSLWGISMATGSSGFTDSVLRLVLICGGALTISGGQLLFARLLGTSAEESREMGQSARTLLSGATTALGGAKAAGGLVFGQKNANGQRVGGLIKGGASLGGTVVGGAVNAMGRMFSGQAYKNSKFGNGVSKVQSALKNFGNSAGWHGQDKTTGQNTLGANVAEGAIKLGSKLENSKLAQNTGLNNGIIGIASKKLSNSSNGLPLANGNNPIMQSNNGKNSSTGANKNTKNTASNLARNNTNKGNK